MVAAWMLYSLAVTALLLGAALLADRAFSALGRGTRRLWLLAMLGGVVVPVVAWMRGHQRSARDGYETLGALAPVVEAALDAPMRILGVDQLLLAGWGVASLLIVAIGVGICASQRRQLRRWPRARVDGFQVRVSRDVGPAVVGFVNPEIVIPGWVLAEEPGVRRMMLRHESEHLAAGDQRLLLAASLLIALMPWNLALWVMLNRLRIAVELECDRRVLSGGLDVRSYGLLLLEMGRRRSRVGWAAAAFSRKTSVLERRIRSMTSSGAQIGRGAVAALGMVVMLGSMWALPAPAFADDGILVLERCEKDREGRATLPPEILDWSPAQG